MAMRLRSRTRQNVLFVMAAIITFIIIYSSYEILRSDSQNMRTVHIVLMAVDNAAPKKSGMSVCERIETLLKSILLFYPGVLHVHIFTNTRSAKTLATLFRTWPISRIRTSFYNVEEEQKSLAWVKSNHLVSGYGQLKYIIHDILPDYVEKAIFIDTDMLVLEDIRILHSYLDEMELKGMMFAAASDQFGRKDLDKLFGKNGRSKSINSGLVLYNLKKMREGDWGNLWRQAGVTIMNKFGTIQTPQDLFAFVAVARPDTYLKLPCVYNFQIGQGAWMWDCVKNATDLWQVKIPHWTGPKKFGKIGHATNFTPILHCVQKMDGYDFVENMKADKYRTLMHLRNTKRAEKPENVTLAAHVHYDNAIALIERLNKSWLGPISLVVCGSSWDRTQLLAFLSAVTLHDYLEVHFVYQRRDAHSLLHSCSANHLRRVAVDATRTNNVLLSDSILEIQVNEDLRKRCECNKNSSSSTFWIRDRKSSMFAGILLERSDAQRLAAGTTQLEEGIKDLKLGLTAIDVDPAEDISGTTAKKPKWAFDAPSDSFCQEEISKRKRVL